MPKPLKMNPLMRLCLAKRDLDGMRSILARGIDVDAVSSDGKTAFVQAAERGWIEGLELLHSYSPAELGATDVLAEFIVYLESIGQRESADFLRGLNRISHDAEGDDAVPTGVGEAQFYNATQLDGSDDDEEVIEWEADAPEQMPADDAALRRSLDASHDTRTSTRLTVPKQESLDFLDFPDPETSVVRKARREFAITSGLANLIQFGIANGYVFDDRLKKVALERVDTDIDLSLSHLRLLCEDLGIEIDSDSWWREPTSTTAESDDIVLCEEETAFLFDLSSQTSDPGWHISTQLEESILLDREEEERIGKLIESTRREAIRFITSNLLALRVLANLLESWLDGTDPSRYIFAAKRQDSDEVDQSPAESEKGVASLYPDEAESELSELRENLRSLNEENFRAGSVHQSVEALGLTFLAICAVADSAELPEAVQAGLRFYIDRIRNLRAQFFESNLRLANSVARKYLWSGVPFADLIQESYLGLLTAIERFDYTRGFKFSTFAMWWVRQNVQRYVSEHSRVIRLPVHMTEKVDKVRRVEARTVPFGPKPMEVSAIAKLAELSISEVQNVHRVRNDAVLFSDVTSMRDFVDKLPTEYANMRELDSDDFPTLAEYCDDLDADEVDAFDMAAERCLISSMHEVLSNLDPRESEVLKRRFGVGGFEPHTLEDVGKEFGVTRERVRQIERKALVRLRHPANSGHLRDYLRER